jgi:AGZA family xanthine/uracil permease-like MFS transporter
MGINAYFAFTLCGLKHVPWAEALGMVFINGILFLLLSITGAREKIIEAIPLSLKLAIAGGIGLFIAFIGLKNAGVIVANPDTFVCAGDFTSGPAALCLAGIGLTSVLIARGVPGAIVLGMAAITVAGLFVPAGGGPMVTTWPGAIFSAPASPAPVFLKLSFGFLSSWPAFLNALPIILTLLLVDLFDNLGTLIGLAMRTGMLDAQGRLPRAGRALLADSLATIVSALFGTSTVVSYIESAAGIEAGGRTGLTGLTTAVLMLLALVLTPLILSIPAAATAPALVVVGILMMQPVAEIPLRDFATAAPAVLTLLAIPLTFSISDGLGLGLVAAAVLALGTGRPRGLSLTAYALAAVFFLQFFKIWPFTN